MDVKMFANAVIVCRECGVETQVEGNNFYFVLDHESIPDFKVRVVHLFLDNDDGKWTLINMRPQMTGTPIEEAYVASDSFEEAVTYALVFFFDRQKEFESYSGLRRFSVLMNQFDAVETEAEKSAATHLAASVGSCLEKMINIHNQMVSCFCAVAPSLDSKIADKLKGNVAVDRMILSKYLGLCGPFVPRNAGSIR